MRERQCFVQFIHPGGEHRPDMGDMRSWNFGRHQRKFLKRPGSYIAGGEIHQGDLTLWGEWEPESRVLERWHPDTRDAPHYLWEPYFADQHDTVHGQNTDPWVYGDCFQYTGCLQHTRRGPTQLRYLNRGSVVLFGSCVERARFVIDTVFVVDSWIDHQADDWRERLSGRVSDTYRTVTMEPWYSSPLPVGQSHRLYFGATPKAPVGEMFSFFPCRPYDSSSRGFARPAISLPGHITPNLVQGKKFTRDPSIAQLSELWGSVVRQVEGQGLALGVTAETPAIEDSLRETQARPSHSAPCRVVPPSCGTGGKRRGETPVGRPVC